MKDVYKIPRSYPLLPDWERRRRKDAQGRWLFFILGLLLIAYMVYYAHAQDRALKQMKDTTYNAGYADEVSGYMYPNPI